MHITIHTSQTWADTFISELNDTHVEAELRTKHIPPQAGSPPASLFGAVLGEGFRFYAQHTPFTMKQSPGCGT